MQLRSELGQSTLCSAHRIRASPKADNRTPPARKTEEKKGVFRHHPSPESRRLESSRKVLANLTSAHQLVHCVETALPLRVSEEENSVSNQGQANSNEEFGVKSKLFSMNHLKTLKKMETPSQDKDLLFSPANFNKNFIRTEC